jgi:hypothetical protein
MVPGEQVFDHAHALAAVWAAAVVAGYPLSRLLAAPLRSRGRWAALPLLGAAYWALSLYVFAFRGGLAVALAVAAVACVIALLRMPRRRGRRRRRHWAAGAVLFVGCAVYVTPLATQYLPRGMDGSRYAVNARLIAARMGLPRHCGPFAPQIPFGAANHGAPALAAVAVMAGASAPGATLAVDTFTMACMVLALYVLLRLATRRGTAATLAVACTWLARSLQLTVGWGGLPGVLALAVGMLALRQTVDVFRRGGLAPAAGAGISLAALPLLHGAAAACWLHTLAPVAAAAGAIVSRQRGRGLLAALLAMAVAAAGIGIYFAAGRPHFDPGAVEWIRTWTTQWISASQTRWPEAVGRYMLKYIGLPLALLLAAAAAYLALRRRWAALTVLAAVVALTALVLANARLRWLPAAVLLYPERAREMPVVAAAVALAAAWRARSWRGRRIDRPALVAAALLLGAWFQHVHSYQNVVVRAEISGEAWRVLQWAKGNLDGRSAYVANLYGTAGAYLPAVAGVAATDWHAHVADQMVSDERMRRTRRVTHVLWIDRGLIRSKTGRQQFDRSAGRLRRRIEEGKGEVLFAAAGAEGVAAIYALRSADAAPPPATNRRPGSGSAGRGP